MNISNKKKQIMMEINELFNIFKIVRHIDNKNEITDNTTFNYKKSKNVWYENWIKMEYNKEMGKLNFLK